MRALIEQLWRRWARVVWYREEMRRVIEMIREDERLRNAESTFFRDMRCWYAATVGAALHGELDGDETSTLHRLLDDAIAGFDGFRAACLSPSVFPDVAAVESLRQAVLEAAAPIDRWFAVEWLRRFGEAPAVDHGALDRAVSVVEAAVLQLQRAVVGAAPSSLLATEHFDWWDAFALPWRPRDEPDVRVVSVNPSASASMREVAIFPWLELRRTLNALGVSILPRATALQSVGDDEPALRSRTNYFYSEHRQKTTPSIALLPDGDVDVARARVERAAHALLFAAAVRNAPGSMAYANATLLEFFFQRLGGTPEFVARRVRRRYGARLDGSHTGLLRAQRPAWAGSDLSVDQELLNALERLDHDAAYDHLFEALRWYYVGSTDADPIPPDIDFVHLRTAIERLLRRADDDQSPRTREQVRRVGELTSRHVTWRCDVVNDGPRNHHQQALWVLCNYRNVSVHGGTETREPYGFERMQVPLGWIFDRLFLSLSVATLIEYHVLPDAPRWRGFIEAFEFWLAGAAGGFEGIWSGRAITLRTRPYDKGARPPLEVRPEWLDPAFVYVRADGPAME